MGSLGFYTGLSALNAAQLALRTIGHNVANANTEGYARRRVLLGPNDPIALGQHLVGTGVSVDEINRTVNEQLEARLRGSISLFGRIDTENSIFSEIEAVLGEPSDTGLAQHMSSFFASVADLSSSPTDPVRASAMINSGVDLAGRLREVATRIESQRTDLSRDLESHVTRLNDLAEEAASLNHSIARIEAGGHTADDLRDRLGVLTQEMAREASIEVIPEQGGARILLEGRALVTGDRTNSLRVTSGTDGQPHVVMDDGDDHIEVTAGIIGALSGLQEGSYAKVLDSLNELASQWILETNRIHARGVPPGGGFASLTSLNAVRDADGDGERLDELLSEAGLPFEMRSGALYVTIVDEASASTRTTRLDLNPEFMTVGDLVEALNGVEDLGASIDQQGRLQLQAQSGHRFHFSGELDNRPDRLGAFGGASAAISSSSGEPFAMTLPADFSVEVDGGAPLVVSLDASMFANPASITAEELAAAIDPQIAGAQVAAQGGRLSIISNSSGDGSSLKLNEGTNNPLAALGLSTALESGSELAVGPEISGVYTGPENTTFRFAALGDGEIGVEPGLQVGVFDSAGKLVTTLDVGKGYEAGDELEVADGIQVSFGAGSISATAGDSFELQAVADPDETDLLPAFALNAFFSGRDALTIGVNQELIDDPTKLATGISALATGNTRLLEFSSLQHAGIDALGGRTLEEFYTTMVSELGSQTARAQRMLDSQTSVVEDLQTRRDQLSGVSVDEEMAMMMQFEEAYTGAARYIQTIQGLNQEILNLV